MTDLADAGMALLADPAGAVTIGVALLANADLVTTGVKHGVNATPGTDRDSYRDHDDLVSPDIGCVGETFIQNYWPDLFIGSVYYDPND